MKSQHFGKKNPDAGKDGWQEEKGMTEDEKVEWHYQLNGREGNGNPLQYSCLENPRDRGAWRAAVYGVAQSWTRLKRLSSSSSFSISLSNEYSWLISFRINWFDLLAIQGTLKSFLQFESISSSRYKQRVTWKFTIPYVKYIANGNLLYNSENSNRGSVTV